MAIPRIPRFLFVATLFAGALMLTSCSDIDGSGVAQTTRFDLETFDQIDIGSTFEANIVVGNDPQSVVVTIDDNLMEHLVVEVRSGRLHVHFDDDVDTDVDPMVEIVVSELSSLDVSGASEARVADANVASFDLDVSGASNASLELNVDGHVDIELSGASDVRVTGSAVSAEIEASGASDLDLRGLDVPRVEVDASGASDIHLGNAVIEVTGELSGASDLAVPGETTVDLESSGSSTVSRR